MRIEFKSSTKVDDYQRHRMRVRNRHDTVYVRMCESYLLDAVCLTDVEFQIEVVGSVFLPQLKDRCIIWTNVVRCQEMHFKKKKERKKKTRNPKQVMLLMSH